jgi:tetratricopeptide (TPR) repeat protein
MQTIDDLTPYYNSRIAVLPWEQRQILEYICETRHPVRVGDIARMCFLPATAAMAQSDTLCALGHLQTLRIGADIYYELREPLMRVSFEVKKHRGKPIGLLLDFLRLWYSPAELKQKFSVLSAKSVPEQIFIPDLQTLEQKWEDPTIAECCRDYAEAAGKGDYERALEATEELVAIRGLKQDMVAQASCLVRLGRLERAGAVCDQLVGSNPEDASLWRLRASILNGLGRYEEALSSCQESLELDPVSGETWNFEASILLHLGRSEEALHCSEAALKLNENDAVALITAGTALADLNLFDLSSKAFLLAVELQPQNTTARLHLCAALIELNRWDEALEQAQHALEMTPNEPEPWVLQGSVLAGMGRKMEALAAFSKAVSNGADSAFVRFKIVELLLSQNRWREAAAQLDRALEKFAQSEDPNAVDTKAMVRSLLPSLSEPRILKLLIQVLLLVYRKHRMIGALAQGLIVCIPDVISSESISDAGSSLWSESWDLMASDLPEFQLPLRLLDSAVRYRNSRDMSVLMKLSQEERTLLEALLGVHVEAIA